MGVRAGTPANMILDTAMVLLSYFFGLRESTVLRLASKYNTELTEERCEVLMRFFKGRTSDEAVSRGPRTYTHSKVSWSPPLYIPDWYIATLGSTGLLFAPVRASPGWLTELLRKLLTRTCVTPPPGCFYSPHSFRIWSLIERILLGGSVIELLTLYYWAHNSEGRLSVYIYRRIRISDYSRLLLGGGSTVITTGHASSVPVRQ